jgi:hypothetical protein
VQRAHAHPEENYKLKRTYAQVWNTPDIHSTCTSTLATRLENQLPEEKKAIAPTQAFFIFPAAARSGRHSPLQFDQAEKAETPKYSQEPTRPKLHSVAGRVSGGDSPN